MQKKTGRQLFYFVAYIGVVYILTIKRPSHLAKVCGFLFLKILETEIYENE